LLWPRAEAVAVMTKRAVRRRWNRFLILRPSGKSKLVAGLFVVRTNEVFNIDFGCCQLFFKW
jgi:hypothetical protein